MSKSKLNAGSRRTELAQPRLELAERGSSSRRRGSISRRRGSRSRMPRAMSRPMRSPSKPHANARLSGVTSSVCRFPSRTTPSLTVRPPTVSWTIRENCRALRMRSPSNSTTMSPVAQAGLGRRAVLVDVVDAHAAGDAAQLLELLGGQVLDRDAELAATAVEHHARCARTPAARGRRTSGARGRRLGQQGRNGQARPPARIRPKMANRTFFIRGFLRPPVSDDRRTARPVPPLADGPVTNWRCVGHLVKSAWRS